MKKLILLIVLIAPSASAQEEEQEIQIEIESGQAAVGSITRSGNSEEAINVAAMPDGSVWYFYESLTGRTAIFCHVNEAGNPRCEEVDIDN